MGLGIDKNPDEAVSYLTLAANQNDMNAQYNLGSCIFNLKVKPTLIRRFTG